MSDREALIAPGWSIEPRNAHLLDPRSGSVPFPGLRLAEGRWRIPFRPSTDRDLPQFDVSAGAGWAIWPLWTLLPLGDPAPPARIRVHGPGAGALDGRDVDPSGGDSLLWIENGLAVTVRRFGACDVHISRPPEQAPVEPIVLEAVALLHRWCGLQFERVRIAAEIQAEDRQREKGYAHRHREEIWCRIQLRPFPAGRPIEGSSRADAVEVVVHELLHFMLEFDTPPGHLLTEGLITYLARRLVADARIGPPGWLRSKQAELSREIRLNPAGDLSLASAARLFFEDLHARQIAYRKGHLAMRALDRALFGRLPLICRKLVRMSKARGRPLRESDFLARLPASARSRYRSAQLASPRRAIGREHERWRYHPPLGL